MKKMKTKGIVILALILIAVTAISCSSSRKFGCPGNPQANTRFRG